MVNRFYVLGICLCLLQSCVSSLSKNDQKIEKLLSQMTIDEKIGQMCQINGFSGQIPDKIKEEIKAGNVGSILNEVDVKTVNEIQKTAIEESRLGIPLLIGRDVVHGFKTIFPIPLGQAATWNPEIVKKGAGIAAQEAYLAGVNWTFAPMIDIARDSRWGRIAESFGEDPYLVSKMAVASTEGFQGTNGSFFSNGKIAACAKHFAGYGAAEGGRDYNTTLIPEGELWDIYFKSFKAAKDAGIRTFMTGFNDLNGVPASGNQFLFRKVLREEWQFDGMVVSDWASIHELISHGFSSDEKDAARKALIAGVDMEMASTCYKNHIKELLDEGLINIDLVDDAVRNILRIKIELGLFENPYVDENGQGEIGEKDIEKAALEAAEQSIVLLKNKNKLLPLSTKINSVAVIGPMAHEKYEQLGTWSFDADSLLSITPLEGIRNLLGNAKVNFAKGLKYTRDKNSDGFKQAIKAAKSSDVVVLCVGEEAILSGEAHCRARLDLPGIQKELIQEISETGKPIVLIVMAGRALSIGDVFENADAVLYAWHPGTMGGAALANILFGKVSPSGKLPITFPKSVGQIPMHYNHKNSGRPVDPNNWPSIDKIPVKAYQTSLGNTSHYMDDGFEPLYPFGFGLSYTDFEYSDLRIETPVIAGTAELKVSVLLSNKGECTAEEVVQVYIRDLVGDVTRPVRELKAFDRVKLKAGEAKRVNFTIPASELSFHNQQMKNVVEPGKFMLWIGGDSNADLGAEFAVK
ncbi:glycoside hydrolase family 3 N-terminal domain-containing protein [Labilibaculum manganireducens]|uniref:glycoside hydrolase family 3 N-terminal domain-containing protein n=1 Tax=Labilibaculum manganireducens TaxID=1940525 RepID=UPI0029F49D95|nr:glycoside hydrolase family 3 N-terminal domain-containing protein [Labilibaculum manganireducens]